MIHSLTFFIAVFSGRLGISVPSWWLCNLNSKIFREFVLVNTHVNNNWGSPHTRNECWVSKFIPLSCYKILICNELILKKDYFSHQPTNKRYTNSADGPRSLPKRGIKSRLLQFKSSYGYATYWFFSPVYFPRFRYEHFMNVADMKNNKRLSFCAISAIIIFSLQQVIQNNIMITTTN